jgi:ABC-type sulfate transport system substrate-binding protein
MREAESTAGITNPWLLWQRELPDQAKAVKVGISSPVLSNGGLQTLIILAVQYHQTTQLNVSQVRDSGFHDWLRQLEVQAWPDSTGTLTTDFVIRPGVYDIITTYESLALQVFRQAEGRFLEVRVYYPETTLLSDHPFTILTAPWVDDAERAAALRLRDFLLSPSEQTIAMREYGFRPVIPQVTINLDDQDSLFGRYRDLGLQLDLKTQLENPSQAVVEALISTWQDVFNQ